MKSGFLIPVLACLVAACGSDPARQGGQVEQAVSQQVAAGEAQRRAKVHTELGSLYLKDARYAVALDEARIAAAADPGYAPAYNLLGLVHMYLNETRFAEDNFAQALRLAPADPEINNNYGWFLCQTGREQLSMVYFQNAIRSSLYETPGKPLTNAGLCSLRVKDDRAAEEFLLRALRFDAENVQALYWLADINYRSARLAEARLRIGELHKLIDPNAESLWLALRIERRIGDREAEVRYATQLRRKFAGTVEHQRLMQGQYD